jgi:RNAse (barnase) inhibitor barstar
MDISDVDFTDFMEAYLKLGRLYIQDEAQVTELLHRAENEWEIFTGLMSFGKGLAEQVKNERSLNDYFIKIKTILALWSVMNNVEIPIDLESKDKNGTFDVSEDMKKRMEAAAKDYIRRTEEEGLKMPIEEFIKEIYSDIYSEYIMMKKSQK